MLQDCSFLRKIVECLLPVFFHNHLYFNVYYTSIRSYVSSSFTKIYWGTMSLQGDSVYNRPTERERRVAGIVVYFPLTRKHPWCFSFIWSSISQSTDRLSGDWTSPAQRWLVSDILNILQGNNYNILTPISFKAFLDKLSTPQNCIANVLSTRCYGILVTNKEIIQNKATS